MGWSSRGVRVLISRERTEPKRSRWISSGKYGGEFGSDVLLRWGGAKRSTRVKTFEGVRSISEVRDARR